MDTQTPAEQPKQVAIIGDSDSRVAAALKATIENGGDIQLIDVPASGTTVTLDPGVVKEVAAPLPPTKEVTEEQMRQLRRMFVTVRHKTVEPCGDKLDINREPRTNCPYCWFVFFNSHGELIQTADECFQKEGRKALEALRGAKFVKNFLKFMATLALMKEQLEAQQAANKEQNEQGIRSADNGGRTVEDSVSGTTDSAGHCGAEATDNGREAESAEGSGSAVGQAVQYEELASPSRQ